MRCIFCKADSRQSRSVEHIIPESLGNTKGVLPRGIVCDQCNNYFARKIEKPLLESDYFIQLRQRQWIRNKRGRVPGVTAVLSGISKPVDLWAMGNQLRIEGRNEPHLAEVRNAILSGKVNEFYVRVPSKPSDRLMSRFLAKIAIEALVDRVRHIPDWLSDYFANEQLTYLRDYARRGERPAAWPFHEREIYAEDKLFWEAGLPVQMVHEMDFLQTEEGEMYCIVCLFGREYSINVGFPGVSGYEKWLSENDFRSPLYPAGLV